MKYDVHLNIVNSNVYFVISNSTNVYASTSYEIATLLGLDTKTYNKILVEKVIQHDRHYNEFVYANDEEDVTFHSNGNVAAIYVKRFKETFEKELILLELGGE